MNRKVNGKTTVFRQLVGKQMDEKSMSDDSARGKRDVNSEEKISEKL